MKHLLLSLGILVCSQGALAQSLSVDGTGDLAYNIYERAPQQPETLTLRNEAGKYVTRIPLAKLRAAQGDIRLLGANATEQVAFNVAAQTHVSSARIVIRHVNGLSQEGLRPQLRVALNGHFVAQLAGVTESGAAINEIRVRPEDIVSGYNTLILNAVQRYTLDCQDPDAPELWTDIDVARSFVELTYERAPFDATLADLDAFMTSGVGGIDALGIITADDVTDADVRLGALASQGVANRLQYGLPRISHIPASRVLADDEGANEFSDMDFVAIGSPSDLSGLMEIDARDLKDGQSYLALRRSPFSDSHFMLVISGLDKDAIERGVIAFSAMNFPMDDEKVVILDQIDIPAPPLIARKGVLQADHVYRFADLGLMDQSVLGQDHATLDLSFDLPADNHFEEDAELPLSLDFAYGAGMEPGSAINILVNDHFRRAIPLKNPDGEVNPGYVVSLEAKDLNPGANRIRFEIELASHVEGRCVARNLDHLAFVLMGSSTVGIPPASHLAELPDLSLMASSGFPYSGIGTEPFGIVAADSQSETLASVWLLAAKLGQMHGALFTEATFGIDTVPEGMHVLLVGSGPDLKRKLPSDLRLSDRSRTVTARLISGSAEQLDVLTARSLGANGLIVSGESPSSRHELVTIVTAQDPSHLFKAVEYLVQPAHWSQMSGGAAVWRAHPATFASQPATDLFFVGDAKASERVKTASRRSPWAWVLSFATLLFVLASILALLARYMRSRTN